ncbi:uncharacterized protein LOC130654959 [Hydractinia symbiolongicarpus]|uniref:uncharacterized protein LOC130654959 n=1 Tax=Hydractinia symbiolongicarpus TaxID=13093 RepID=UPI00254ACB5C|nr:uncharacterized protein LOC130654959 [Hydractinia symbiolongicarpus]
MMANLTNESLDHYAEGCFKTYDKIACSRDALEAILAFVTVIFCIVKIVKLHLAKHELWNQYMIFYSAIVEILLLALNWVYAHQATLDLVAELLKLFQFLVVCRFYGEIVSRMSKRENLYKKTILPALLLVFIYFVVLIIVGIVRMKDNTNECVEPEWLQLSCSEVALGIAFMIVGVYITQQTNKLKTDHLFKRSIKRSLWGIILSFELSALLSMAYDVTMIFIGKDNRCKGVFLTDPVAFTISHVIVKITKWLLPIWAMILVFKPDSFRGGTKSYEDSEQPPIVQRSSVGVFKSEFRPRGRSFNYKHLRNPENESERNLLAPNAVAEQEKSIPKRKKKSRRTRVKSGGSSTAEGDSSNSPTSPPTQTKNDGVNNVDVSVSINASSSAKVIV